MSRLEFDCSHRIDTGFELNARFVAEGDVVGLVGPSGAGKTTIAQMIAGLVRPDRGRICLGPTEVINTETNLILPPERRGIGMVFQDQSLFPHMSVRANLTYGLRRRGGDREILERAVKMLEIEDLTHRRTLSLSGGQQQRVALARAVASRPKWLILDEPLTAVEAELRDRILDYLERVIQEFGIPTLLISHQTSMIRRLADQVIEIHQGKVNRVE